MSTPSIVRINADAALDEARWHPGPIAAIIECRPFADSSSHAPWPATVPFPLCRGDLAVRLMPAQAADAHCQRVSPRSIRVIDKPGCVLMPGLVNGHTHLDLTHLGPFPDGRGSFGSFFAKVRQGRHADPADIARSVQSGIECSLLGGVVAVGDIAGCPPASGPSVVPFQTLAASPLRGVSYLEFFAIGTREIASIARLEHAWDSLRSHTPRPSAVRAGLHPHAPYSVSLAAYARAVELAARDGVPISTHLAESPAEHELVAQGTGPFRAFLESLGLWTPELLTDFGRGRTPVEHLAPVLARAAGLGVRPLTVHLNDLGDGDLAAIASCAHAVYCPRSSAYFRAESSLGPHRYRDLINAGVKVCLGTDSILNVDGPGLTPLDDARLLYQRDSLDPTTLAAMLTTHGATALGLEPSAYRFAPSSEPAPLAGLISIPADDRTNPGGVFAARTRPELLAIGR